MVQYVCHNCDMSVRGLTCGSCGEELAHETITNDTGATVNVSKCPTGCGQIKSPQCCGNDMHNH
jgi:hypothetical protein